jgi:hypothetical protein
MASFPVSDPDDSIPEQLPPYSGPTIPDTIPPDGPQIGPPDPFNSPTDQNVPEGDIDEGGEDPVTVPNVERDEEVDAVDNDSPGDTTVADAGDVSGGGDDAGGDGGGGGDEGGGDN